MPIRLLLMSISAYVCMGHAAERFPDGGGPLPTEVHDRIAPQTYRQLHQSPIRPPAVAKGVRPTLAFPLRQAVGEADQAFHGVSNFVDQDPAFPDEILDFECGQRTYDLQSGYNHRGVDFFTWPFSWRRMENDDVAVVAAAPGVISAKLDSEPDRSCGNDEQAQANYVVVRHDDGSESIYLHLKTGSATRKLLGERVDEGEYLGIVGSSGYSTGPHLHFEVHDPGDNIIEPYAGSCNMLNVESWWQDQLPYYDSRINRLATHSQPPEFLECPQTERPNFQNQFAPGDKVFLGAYYHDQRLGQRATLTVVDSDGSVFTSFEFALDRVFHYNASYWWWSIDLPTDAPPGEWTFRAEYEGEIVEHEFVVGQSQVSTPPIPDTNAQYAGLWYSPALEGEGFNLIPTASGLVVYFYGSDRDAERLWLVSATIPGTIEPGQVNRATMFESTGGVFNDPVTSRRGLSEWGVLEIAMEDCANGVVKLVGRDGDKQANVIKLAGVAGSGCGSSGDSSGLSGLWYSPVLDGEGFNLVESDVGSLIYYYGFNRNGQRQWLVSDVIPDPVVLNVAVSTNLYSSTSGTFSAPVGSADSLEYWGTVSATRTACDAVSLDLRGRDGRKISDTVRLARIIGDVCP